MSSDGEAGDVHAGDNLAVTKQNTRPGNRKEEDNLLITSSKDQKCITDTKLVYQESDIKQIFSCVEYEKSSEVEKDIIPTNYRQDCQNGGDVFPQILNSFSLKPGSNTQGNCIESVKISTRVKHDYELKENNEQSTGTDIYNTEKEDCCDAEVSKLTNTGMESFTSSNLANLTNLSEDSEHGSELQGQKPLNNCFPHPYGLQDHNYSCLYKNLNNNSVNRPESPSGSAAYFPDEPCSNQRFGDEYPYKCLDSSDYSANRNNHDNPKAVRLYSCSYCLFTTHQLDAIEFHVDKGHVDQEASYTVTKHNFGAANSKPNHGYVECSYCNFATAQRDELKKHVAGDHSHESKVLFGCPNCDYVHERRASVLQHGWSCHNEVVSINTVRVTVDISPSTGLMPDMQDSKHHILNNNEPESKPNLQVLKRCTGTQIYKHHCEECSYSTNDPAAFNEHTHLSNEQPLELDQTSTDLSERKGISLNESLRKYDTVRNGNAEQIFETVHSAQGPKKLSTLNYRLSRRSIFKNEKKCPNCTFSTKIRWNYIRHMHLRHSGTSFTGIEAKATILREKYSCSKCAYVTCNLIELECHRQEIHSKCLPIDFSRRNSLELKSLKEKAHKKPEAKMHSCMKCPYKRMTKALVMKHVTEVHVNPIGLVEPCNICGEITLTNRLHNHIAKMHGTKLRCSHCPYKAKRHDLVHHVKKLHSSSPIEKIVCNVCGVHCTTQFYQRHFKTHPEDRIDTNQSANKSQDYHHQTYTCLYCPFSDQQREVVDQHEVKLHDPCLQTHICEQCGVFCSDDCALKDHMSNECGQKYLYVHNSQKQVKIKTKLFIEPKRYKCQFCAYKSRWKGDCKRHEKRHTSAVRLIMCTECEICIPYKSLIRHQKRCYKHKMSRPTDELANISQCNSNNDNVVTGGLETTQHDYAEDGLKKEKKNSDYVSDSCLPPHADRLLSICDSASVTDFHDKGGTAVEVKEVKESGTGSPLHFTKAKTYLTCKHCPFKSQFKHEIHRHQYTLHLHGANALICKICGVYLSRRYASRHLKYKHGLNINDNIDNYTEATTLQNPSNSACDMPNDQVENEGLGMKMDNTVRVLSTNDATSEFDVHNKDTNHSTDGGIKALNKTGTTPLNSLEAKPFLTCDHCPFKSQFKNEIHRHQKTLHSHDAKPLICKICGVYLSRRYSSRHLKCKHGLIVKNEMENFSEPIAIQNDGDSVGNNEHSDQVENEGQGSQIDIGVQWYTCDLCPYVASRLSILRVHKKNHYSKNPFVCSVCTYKGQTIAGVKLHYIKKHPGVPPQVLYQGVLVPETKNKTMTLKTDREVTMMEECENNKPSEGDKEHYAQGSDSMKRKHLHVCKICPYTSQFKTVVDIHMKRFHSSGCSSKECHICGVYLSEKYFSMHMRNKHGAYQEDPDCSANTLKTSNNKMSSTSQREFNDKERDKQLLVNKRKYGQYMQGIHGRMQLVQDNSEKEHATNRRCRKADNSELARDDMHNLPLKECAVNLRCVKIPKMVDLDKGNDGCFWICSTCCFLALRRNKVEEHILSDHIHASALKFKTYGLNEQTLTERRTNPELAGSSLKTFDNQDSVISNEAFLTEDFLTDTKRVSNSIPDSLDMDMEKTDQTNNSPGSTCSTISEYYELSDNESEFLVVDEIGSLTGHDTSKDLYTDDLSDFNKPSAVERCSTSIDDKVCLSTSGRLGINDSECKPDPVRERNNIFETFATYMVQRKY